MNLVVAGAVAVAPAIGCDSDAQPVADAASQTDGTGSPDRPDAGTDTVAAADSAFDAEDDASLDAYPDGVRG